MLLAMQRYSNNLHFGLCIVWGMQVLLTYRMLGLGVDHNHQQPTNQLVQLVLIAASQPAMAD